MDEVRANEVDRRRFLKRAGTIAWSAPVIYTLMAEHALAQSTPCSDTQSPGPTSTCVENTTCPSSAPRCCRVNALGASDCRCYPTVNSQTGCTAN